MDSREAKQILSQYRPGETTHVDRRMADALNLAQQDPELAIWFGQHCAALAQTPPESAVGKTSLVNEEPKPKPEAEKDESIILLNKPALYLITMTFLGLMATWLWPLLQSRPPNTFASYRDRMARLVQRTYPLKIIANDQSEIRQYFRTNSRPADFELARGLEKLPGLGGSVFTWHSQPVELMGLDAGGKTNLFLFLINRSAFGDTPVPARFDYHRVGRVMTVGWTSGDDVYLLTGPNDETIMKGFVE